MCQKWYDIRIPDLFLGFDDLILVFYMDQDGLDLAQFQDHDLHVIALDLGVVTTQGEVSEFENFLTFIISLKLLFMLVVLNHQVLISCSKTTR